MEPALLHKNLSEQYGMTCRKAWKDISVRCVKSFLWMLFISTRKQSPPPEELQHIENRITTTEINETGRTELRTTTAETKESVTSFDLDKAREARIVWYLKGLVSGAICVQISCHFKQRIIFRCQHCIHSESKRGWCCRCNKYWRIQQQVTEFITIIHPLIGTFC